MKKHTPRKEELVEWDAWYKRHVTRYVIPSKEEERALLIRAHAGDVPARDELILRNLRLVLALVKKNLFLFRPSIPFSDIVQAGNVGLIDAVNDFDPVKFKTRFSTYAEYHIKKRFIELIQRDQLIRIPADMNRQIRGFYSTRERLLIELGREATIREIADALGISVKRAQALEILSWGTVSCDTSESFLLEFMRDPSLSPLDALLKDEAETILQFVLSQADEKNLAFLQDYLNAKGYEEAAKEVRKRYKLKNYSSASDKAAHVRKRIHALFTSMGASAEHLFL